MFTTNHFIWMGICIGMIGVLLLVSLHSCFSAKTASRVMAVIAMASELCKIFTHMQQAAGGGEVLEPQALPLHLCSIMIFLIFYCALSGNSVRVAQVTAFCMPVAIWGGLLAILMATSGVDFAKPYAYQCFLYHAGLLWWALHLLCTGQVDLGRKAYLRNLVVLGGLLFGMLWVNSTLSVYDTNFFYVVRPPVDGLPLLNLNHGWPVYFVILAGLGLLGVTLVHLPAMWKEQKR